MPHESVEGPTFTADQSSNPKISLTLYFVQHGFKVMRKKNSNNSVPTVHRNEFQAH